MGLAWSRICYMRFLYGNLSSSGLVGEIPSIIGNLTELQYLDLSRNDLTGDIPDFLCGLSHLGFLDLSGNGLNASIPQALRERVAAGTLTLRIGNTTNLCGYPNSCGNSIDKKSSKKVLIAVAATISSVLLLVAVLVIICILRKCTGDKVKKEGASCGEIGCKEFAFEDLVRITRNFSKEIGKGAFGHVYYGELDGNISVAVKVLLITPLQGLEEFKKEHHFLQNPSQEPGQTYNVLSICWNTRLQIAIDCSRGLEYLHTGCRPAIIHRDIKPGNILLGTNMEAKIGDFGLSIFFKNDIQSHVSTIVKSTAGYLDPEYHLTGHLNEKSDVYSFGVVLLQLITGMPAILRTENMHIAQFVKPSFDNGKIDDVIDKRINGRYNIISVSKAVELALACCSTQSTQRPSMTEVLICLLECLELQENYERYQNPVEHHDINGEIHSAH